MKKSTYSKDVMELMRPKDTSKHPWRKANSNLKNYSQKALAERKKLKERL